jgi:hypothetical protein
VAVLGAVCLQLILQLHERGIFAEWAAARGATPLSCCSQATGHSGAVLVVHGLAGNLRCWLSLASAPVGGANHRQEATLMTGKCKGLLATLVALAALLLAGVALAAGPVTGGSYAGSLIPSRVRSGPT